MDNSANTYQNMGPIFKESYASKSMKTHKKPGKEEKFSNLKKKLTTSYK